MSYSIKEMCAAGCTSPRGVHWWEEQGLLGEVARTSGNQRTYTEEQIRRARIISAAQYCSFTLAEIGEMLKAYDLEAYSALQIKLASVANTALTLGEGLPMPFGVIEQGEAGDEAPPMVYDL